MNTHNCNDKIKRINALLLLIIAGCFNAFSEVNYDVNDDGEVTWADYDILKVQIENPNQSFLAKYDIDSNGIIDEIDANMLRKEIQRRALTTFTVNGVSFKMVAVEGGTFTMGATREQGSDANNGEKPAHQVTLSSFNIGQTEVTQALWVAVMGTNPSYFTGNMHPVHKVSWNDCQSFITKLNQMTGQSFRLPTEAEWEYAARGGNRSMGYKYSGSNNVSAVAWYYDNSYAVGSSSPNYGVHTVATKAANELGLYDMSGNVCEWCQDWYGNYSSDVQANPTGPASGSHRVFRGGCWERYAEHCRVSDRVGYPPANSASFHGLRLAIDVIQLATGISLNKTSATINNGETLQLTATVTPSNANNSAVIWTSSNTSIATVNSNGLVTAKGRGTATITATTADGSNLSATCQVTVNQLATGITLDKTYVRVVVDKTTQLTATITPSNTTNKSVSWTSSNSNVAIVSSSGLVTAKAVGEAEITATTADGSNLSAVCNVTVAPQLATVVSLDKSTATINNGETLQLTATVSPSNATNKSVTWTSSNTSVATVNSNGLVTANGRGTVTITATTADGSNLSASCRITVNQLATGITLNKTSATINNGETLQLTAIVLPSNVTNAIVTWTSSNTNVATVSSNGQVTAKGRGTATITATTTDGTNLSASCSVTVNQLATGISLNRTYATINNGENLQLTATVSPSNVNNSTVTWASSNTSVASVNSSGLVTAKSRGTATITATTADGSNLSASCSVTVNQLATGISLNKTQATIIDGNTLQLTASITPNNANNQTVTWSTSNSNVATVSNSGLVTAQNPGTATITATTHDGSNLSASCQVTVTEQLATSISLNQTTASVVVDKTLQLTATVSPSNTTNKSVTWTSSNTSVARVSSSGLVTAKAVGNATITATTQDGTNLSATCQVTVTPQLATSISLNKTSATIYDGTTLQLAATISPSNTTNKSIAWTSSNTAVATVSSGGLVTALKPGTATITVTTQDGSNLSATCQLTVQKQLATSITLNQNSLEIGTGQTATLTATVLPENTTDKRVMWTSSNTAIASVAAGLVQGNSMGECIITATTLDGSNISATCHVVVTNGGGSQQGDNYLTADDIEEVNARQIFSIPIMLVNQDPITSIQAELYLPSGFEPYYVDTVYNTFVTLEPSRMGRGHIVYTTPENGVATRILVSSSRNAAFQGNDGEVMYIHLKASEGLLTGLYGIDLKNIILSTTTGEMIEAPNVKINVGVETYHSGDANGDGFIDNADYMVTVDYIMGMGNNHTNFIFNAADMSGDGRVYVNDLTLIIDAALAFDFEQYQSPKRTPAQATANNKLYVSDFEMEANKNKTLSINLDNATAFTAIQCDVNLPAGMSIVQLTDEWGDPTYSTIVASRSSNHDVWTDITNHNDVRIIITNSSNMNIKGNSGAVATFKVKTNAAFSGEHQLVLKNIVCVDEDAVRYALPDAVCYINKSATMVGDVDGNGEVNGADLNILINIILGKDSADNYDGRANVDGNGGVDGSDINALINILLGK